MPIYIRSVSMSCYAQIKKRTARNFLSSSQAVEFSQKMLARSPILSRIPCHTRTEEHEVNTRTSLGAMMELLTLLLMTQVLNQVQRCANFAEASIGEREDVVDQSEAVVHVEDRILLGSLCTDLV